MSIYTPTYLYIKQHTKTGKLYFGKTIKNPETYLGSGKHWKNHIKAHGEQFVVNLWYELFTDKDGLVEFATQFSDKMRIVESDQWLNLKIENGLDGNVVGNIHTEDTKDKIRNRLSGQNHPNFGKHRSEETRQKVSKGLSGKPKSDEHIHKMSVANTGKITPLDTKKKISNAMKGIIRPTTICPHCGKIGQSNIMTRWHFDNCKVCIGTH